MEPEVILFDEPTSALDPMMVGEVKDIMKKLVLKGQTMLIVTHDMSLAEEVSNRIFYMDQGGIYEDNSPDVIFHNPKRARTKAFIENLNVIKTSIHGDYNQDAINKEVDSFIIHTKINEDIANKIKFIYDEFLFDTLLDKYKIKDIRFILSYDPKKMKVYINCKYSGEIINILTKANNPSIRLLNNIKNIKHNVIKEKKYTNQLLFEIKK